MGKNNKKELKTVTLEVNLKQLESLLDGITFTEAESFWYNTKDNMELMDKMTLAFREMKHTKGSGEIPRRLEIIKSLKEDARKD